MFYLAHKRPEPAVEAAIAARFDYAGNSAVPG
jgi:hypothetical protein